MLSLGDIPLEIMPQMTSRPLQVLKLIVLTEMVDSKIM